MSITISNARVWTFFRLKGISGTPILLHYLYLQYQSQGVQNDTKLAQTLLQYPEKFYGTTKTDIKHMKSIEMKNQDSTIQKSLYKR